MPCCGDGLWSLCGLAPALPTVTRSEKRKPTLPKPKYEGRGRRLVSEHAVAKKDLSDFYEIDKQIGKGAFGTVRLATAKQTGKTRVIKTMDKAEIPEDVFEFIANELEILSFCDHPNIARLYHTFEDDDEIHCAMQLCGGGELAKRLQDRGPFPEEDVKVVMMQLLRGVHYLHSICQIAHRDLKLENAMLKSSTLPLSANKLKIIDFGFAKGFSPGKLSFNEMCGTPGYMAPEILRDGRYSEKCDLFSCGVMLYELTCGRMPFEVRSTEDLMDAFDQDFYHGRVTFQEPQWQRASGHCKHLAMRLCAGMARRRPSAEESLGCSWLQDLQGAPMEEAVHKSGSLKPRMSQNLKDLLNSEKADWSPSSHLRKEALHHIAYNLEDHEVEGEQALFDLSDKNGDGQLSRDELTELCKCLGLVGEEASHVFQMLDADADGIVSYTDFLRIALPGRQCNREALLASFNAFDQDKDGKISAGELKKALGKANLSDEDILRIMKKVDQDNDGALDFGEFMAALPVLSP